MAPGLWEWMVLRNVARCCSRVWDAVVERIRAKGAVELEEVWNQGTARAIATLPAGAELEEHSPGGGHRHLRIPSPGGSTGPPAPGPALLNALQQRSMPAPPPTVGPPAHREPPR